MRALEGRAELAQRITERLRKAGAMHSLRRYEEVLTETERGRRAIRELLLTGGLVRPPES